MAGAAPGPPPGGELLRLDGVSKAYRSAHETTFVLQGCDLTLRRGEITCLVGASGTGKSTLVSLIAGLLVPDGGRVLFDGQDLGRLSDAGRARLRAARIGLVLQSGNLVPFLTAAENVALAARFAGRGPGPRAVGELLEQVGVADRAGHMPRRLSGGEAQRVALAVALVNSPDLLLADEVVGALDPPTARQVMDAIGRSCRDRGLAVLLVTHSPRIAALGTQVLRLAGGRLESVA